MPSLDELVEHWGYGAIALIVLLGNIGVPVPEETILALGGYLAWQGQLRISLVLAVGIVSAVTGDSLGYWVGQRRGPKAIERYARRWVGGPSLLERTRALVRRRGMLAVFVARFVPGLRFMAGPLAGATGMRFGAFAIANVLGAVVYVPLVTAAGWGVGYGLGDYLARLRHVIGRLEHVVLAAVVLGIIATLGLRAVRASRDRRSRGQ
jgi:membrane protein DedA with SNARE-associated domain